MKNSILLLIILIASFSSNAQNGASPESITNNFFHVYEKSGLKVALDSVFAYGDKDVLKALPYIKDTLAGTIKAAGGKYCGYELLYKKNITPSYCFYSFLVKYPANPIRYNFIFYKPQDKWIILNFSFDSNLSTELEDFGKLHFLK